MNLSAESLIEAALLLQAEPISERRMRELCQPPLTDLGALVLPDMPEPPTAQEEAHDSGDTDQ